MLEKSSQLLCKSTIFIENPNKKAKARSQTKYQSTPLVPPSLSLLGTALQPPNPRRHQPPRMPPLTDHRRPPPRCRAAARPASPHCHAAGYSPHPRSRPPWRPTYSRGAGRPVGPTATAPRSVPAPLPHQDSPLQWGFGGEDAGSDFDWTEDLELGFGIGWLGIRGWMRRPGGYCASPLTAL